MRYMVFVISIIAGVIGASIFKTLRPGYALSKGGALLSGLIGGSVIWFVLVQGVHLRGEVGSILLILTAAGGAGAATCALLAVLRGPRRK